MKDFPQNQKISILEPKSAFGYDDLLYQGGYHSTTVTCTSKKGTLFLMRKEQFFRLHKSPNSWDQVENMVAYRTHRQNADDIQTNAVRKEEAEEEKSDHAVKTTKE